MAINFLGLPQHYDNTAKLRTAENTGLISEPEYKTMSGHDASENVWGLGELMGPLKPYSNIAASTLYNVDKSIRNPGDYFDETGNPKVGPMESIDLNVKGALEGLTPELKEKYEGILGLDLKSLTDTWAPDDLTDFSGVYNDEDEYDFSGIEGQTAMIDPFSIIGMAKAGFSKKQIAKYLVKEEVRKAAIKKFKPVFSGNLTGGPTQTTPGGYTGPQTQDFNPQQFAKAGRRADKPGGFTDPGKDSYGPHKAYGGRVSYFDGGLASLWLR